MCTKSLFSNSTPRDLCQENTSVFSAYQQEKKMEASSKSVIKYYILRLWFLRVKGEVTQSCPTLQSHGLQSSRLLCPWEFPGKSTGVGCHCLLLNNLVKGLSPMHHMAWDVRVPVSEFEETQFNPQQLDHAKNDNSLQ